MNFGRLAVAAVAAWAVDFLYRSLVFRLLLVDVWAQHSSVLRLPADIDLPLGVSASMLGFLVFAYMYAKGYEGTSGFHEGLRFGVLVGLLIVAFGIAWHQAIARVSMDATLLFALVTILGMSLSGLVVGTVYKPMALPNRPAPA